MAIDRVIWAGTFDGDQFPMLPCPACRRGRVAFDKSSLRLEEPRYSSLGPEEKNWIPTFEVNRFSAHLHCVEPKCGEVVVILGDTEFIEVTDDEVGFGYSSVLRPRMMFPAPPIIGLPEDTPWLVKNELAAAFGLYWYDTGSSANSVRKSLEFLLDHLKVPRISTSKKTGKPTELDLNGRIQFYEKTSPSHASTFHALRTVGNLGSHGAAVTLEVLLDAFEIYEDALADLIDGRRKYLEELRNKIISTKGKY